MKLSKFEEFLQTGAIQMTGAGFCFALLGTIYGHDDFRIIGFISLGIGAFAGLLLTAWGKLREWMNGGPDGQ